MFSKSGIVAAMAGCAMVAGCNHKATRADDQRSASGQVLSGSISDAMLPYEQTRSQPPLAPRVVEHGPADAATAADSDATPDSATPDAPASPADPSAPGLTQQ